MINMTIFGDLLMTGTIKSSPLLGLAIYAVIYILMCTHFIFGSSEGFEIVNIF